MQTLLLICILVVVVLNKMNQLVLGFHSNPATLTTISNILVINEIQMGKYHGGRSSIPKSFKEPPKGSVKEIIGKL